MKKILCAVLILAAYVSYAETGINLLSPKGGEVISRSANLEILWSLSDQPVSEVYVDHYKNNTKTSILVQKFNNPESSTTGISLPASYILYKPGSYKARLVGYTSDGTRVTVESESFFMVTDKDVITCEPTDKVWGKGEKQTFTVEWTDVTPGRRYAMYLLNVSEHIGDGYGFLLGEGTIPKKTGDYSFNSPFPNKNMSAYPEYHLSVPVSGSYRVLVVDLDTYSRTWSANSIFVFADDVVVEATPREHISLPIGESKWYLKLNATAAYSSATVKQINIPFGAWIEDTNTVLSVALMDEAGRKVSPSRLISGGENFVSFELSYKKDIKQGRSTTLFLVVKVLGGQGSFDINLGNHSGGSAEGKHRAPLSSHFIWQWGNGATIVP